MEVPGIEPYVSTELLKDASEDTRIQMSAIDFKPNYWDDYWLGPAAPDALLEVIASYQRAMAYETGFYGIGTDIEQLKRTRGHYWIFTPRQIFSGERLGAGAASMKQDPSGMWGLEWIYIHPFERGNLLVDIKTIFDDLYPDCVFLGPFSDSGKKACLKLADGDKARLL